MGWSAGEDGEHKVNKVCVILDWERDSKIGEEVYPLECNTNCVCGQESWWESNEKEAIETGKI